jgi:hypothetical protein
MKGARGWARMPLPPPYPAVTEDGAVPYPGFSASRVGDMAGTETAVVDRALKQSGDVPVGQR